MNFPRILLLSLLGVTPLLSLAAEDDEEGVRLWRSKQGKQIKARIIGIEDGKVILQPPVKPYRVPLDSLSDADKEFALKWEKENKETLAMMEKARLDALYATPVLKAIRGSLYKLENGALEEYKIAQPENLKYVGFYFTQKHDDKHIAALSKIYERLRKRSDAFEIVLVGIAGTEEEIKSYMEQFEVVFPSIELVLARKGVNPTVAKLFNRKIVPQLVIVDTQGKVISDSYENETSAMNMKTAINGLERSLRRLKPDDGDAG